MDEIRSRVQKAREQKPCCEKFNKLQATVNSIPVILAMVFLLILIDAVHKSEANSFKDLFILKDIEIGTNGLPMASFMSPQFFIIFAVSGLLAIGFVHYPTIKWFQYVFNHILEHS